VFEDSKKGMEGLEMIDWEEEWKKRYENSIWVRQLKRKGVSSVEYWDKCPFGERIEKYEKYANYPGPILGKIMRFVNDDTEVLDIGAGAGAYTIPLAKVAKKVTVIEPSKGQISRLIKRARRENVNNIEIINKRWEDVDEDELGKYDLTIAAYCFSMLDIKSALQKMLNVTKNVLFLVCLVDHDFKDVYKIIAGKHDSDPDYIYIYNILCQMGVYANVEIVTREYLLPLDLQLEVLRYSYDTTPDVEDRIKKYLTSTNRLVEKNGKIWVKRRYKDAVIYYQIERSND